MLPETKPWWQSRGVIGGIVTVIAVVAGLLGVDLDEGALTEAALQIATAVGGIVAMWGRISARKLIG